MNQTGPAHGQFSIQKVYTRDISVETPNSPAIFQEQWQPTVDIQMDSTHQALQEGLHEVVLSITVTVKVGERTAFLVEVNQAGVFTVQGLPEPQLAHMLGAFCPNILFPYAREAVTDLSTRAGFPPLILAPVNFEALYAQRMQQQAQQGDQAQPGT
jgi:preprotein translocase subunit SecB